MLHRTTGELFLHNDYRLTLYRPAEPPIKSTLAKISILK